MNLAKICFASLALCSVSLCSTSAAPNIILIMTDDLGYGDIYNLHQHTRDNGAGVGGIAGDGFINGSEEAFIYTPNIDRMAAEGAKLTRHYTSAPVCAPARGSLLQGRDQGHANIRNNSFDKVISDNHTLGTVMKEAGYYTACIGKWGVGGNSPTASGRPNARGFDYFYGYIRHTHGHQHYPGNGGTVVEQTSTVTSGLSNAYTTDLWTAKTKQIIQERTNNHPDEPFFIYLAYDAPHAQLQVPTQAYPAGSGTSGGLSWPLNTNSGTNDSYIHPDYSSLSNAAARHATMVRRIDTCMGDILQTLRDLEIDDNTLVVFTSDNGTHNESGSGGSIAHNPRNFDSYGNLEGIKRDQWEGGIRMPTFAWWPTKIGDNNAATPGLNSIRPSAFWDWMPTIVDAAGLTPPAWSSGVSLLPELTATGTQQDKGYLYFEYNVGGSTPNYADFPVHGGSSRGEMQTIFMDDTDGKRYKGVRYNTSSHSKDFLIYDVDVDPGEATNLAASHSALQQKMKDKVLQVRIDGDYNRSYLTSEYAPPSPPTSSVNGLEYKAYTGTWAWVPETAYMTPVASGESTHLDLGKRPQDDHILLEFTGYISLPSDGNYTFQMTTDSTVGTNASGGMLWIHDANVVDDDFNHDGSAVSGSMRLKAGLHPIRVLYKHTTGSHSINLQYSGPGISLQDVPNSVLFRAGVTPPEPVANPDTATTTGVTQVSIPVINNDSDDGLPSPLSIQSVGSAGFGSVVINGSNIDYTADAGKYGTDQFNYTITDGTHTATATVTVNVLVPSQDSVVLHTDFTGFSTAGTTISNFSWSSDIGEAANASTSLRCEGSASGFNSVSTGAGGTGPAVGIAGNIETTGPWHTSFTFTPSQALDLSSFDISSYSVSNSGGHQGASHSVNWALEISSNEVNFDGHETQVEPGGNSQHSFSIDTSGTALEAGTNYTFKLTVSSTQTNGNNIAFDTLTLNQSPLPDSDRDMWYYRHFGISSPSSIDWQSDSDNDGSNQLAEHAFGGHPHVPDQSIVTPTATHNRATDKLEVSFNRRAPGTHDLTYTVEVSDDLDTWILPATEISSIPHPTLGSDFVWVTVETDNTTSSESRQFIRVRVE